MLGMIVALSIPILKCNIQHNDIWHDGTQHNNIKCNTQHNNVKRNTQQNDAWHDVTQTHHNNIKVRHSA